MSKNVQASRPPEGDLLFSGLNMRDETALAPGEFVIGENTRCNNKVPETRKGVIKPFWAHRVDEDGRARPFTTPYGAGVFRDPDGRSWIFIACGGGVYRTTPNNMPRPVTLPTGVVITGPCTFVQAFNKLFLFRGRHFPTLVMDDTGLGFRDAVPYWDAATEYAVGDRVAFGAWQTPAAGAVTSVGGIATVVLTDHGFVTGQDVTVRGAVQAAYNGRFNVTVLDADTFTYAFGGSATSPATGTIKVSNQRTFFQAVGSRATISTFVYIGGITIKFTATTSAAHGFSNGDRVVISGIYPAEYNGTYVIYGVTATTFDVDVATALTANGTANPVMYANTDVVFAAQDPDTNPEAWYQVYDVLPNADNGLYVNNRLLVPTAYTPGSLGYDSSSSYTKKDFLIATDYQDEVRFDFANEFRINQGSSDEIVDVLKFTDDTVLVFKDGSWYVLSNVSFDLSQLKLDTRGREYGLASRGAMTLAGTDALFLAGKRGVVSVRQTEQGKIQSLDLPLSYPVEKLIDRIAWPIARTTARMAYWNNKLYVAVPLDDGAAATNKNVIPAGATYTVAHGGAQRYGILPLPAGTYHYVPGRNENAVFVAGTEPMIPLTVEGDIVVRPDSLGVEFIGKINNAGRTDAVTATLSLKPLQGVNNTVLVYDFTISWRDGVSVASNQGKWVGRDTGPAQCVLEYFLFPYGGVDRLFYLDALGWINLVEESDNGCDQVEGTGTDGFGWEPIAYRWRSRWFANTLSAMVQPTAYSMVMQTWNPRFDLDVIFQGVKKLTQRVSDKTKDRTRYYRPWDREPYDPTNVNDDHQEPERQDYSVDISEGVRLGENGVLLNAFQEVIENFAISGRMGRRFCLEVRNTQGRIRVLGFDVEETESRVRRGAQE